MSSLRSFIRTTIATRSLTWKICTLYTLLLVLYYIHKSHLATRFITNNYAGMTRPARPSSYSGIDRNLAVSVPSASSSVKSGQKPRPNTEQPKRWEDAPEPAMIIPAEPEGKGEGGRDYEGFVMGSKDSRERYKDPGPLGGLPMGLLGGDGLFLGV